MKCYLKKPTHCYICQKKLESDRVRDHCHETGKFRRAAHNLLLKQKERIPVLFHNLRGYDSHLIIQASGKIKHKDLSCIPKNYEKYISFSMGKLDCVDLFQFLSTPLKKPCITLQKKVQRNSSTSSSTSSECFQDLSQKSMELLIRKDVYPYEYMDT